MIGLSGTGPSLRPRVVFPSRQELKEQNELLYESKQVLEEQVAGIAFKEEHIGENIQSTLSKADTLRTKATVRLERCPLRES